MLLNAIYMYDITGSDRVCYLLMILVLVLFKPFCMITFNSYYQFVFHYFTTLHFVFRIQKHINTSY